MATTPSKTTSKPHSQPGPAPVYDWVKGQQLYEAGILSINQIAKQLGCSDSAVANMASRKGWLRDPTARAKVEAERQALIAKESEQVKTEIISISARQQADVLVQHRKRIAIAQKVVTDLLEEVSKISSEQELFDELGELMNSPDERGIDRLNKAYRRVISLPERASCLNTLATALKTLIMLERQAFGIEGRLEDPETPKDTTEVVRGLDAIMDKFNQVLAQQVPVSPEGRAAELPVIIDVSPTPQAATAISAV